MKELIFSKVAGPWLNKFLKKQPCLTGIVIIRNSSLWLLLEISISYAKVKKRNLKTNGKKNNQKGHEQINYIKVNQSKIFNAQLRNMVITKKLLITFLMFL